jgi:hypothetical protein
MGEIEAPTPAPANSRPSRVLLCSARNIVVRLPRLHATVRRVLRQAWEMDDAYEAKKLIIAILGVLALFSMIVRG